MAPLMVALLFGAGPSMGAPVEHLGPRGVSSVVLAAWYEKHDLEGARSGLPLFASQETEKAASLLGLSAHVPTMLSMWHRESGYIVQDGDDGESYGLTQTLKAKEDKWRRFWRARGVVLGSLADPTAQVFFGVAEFSECLSQARGDEFDAVRRYNGSGRWAKRYAWRVFISRKIIFGLPVPRTPAARAARLCRRLA